MATIAAYTGPSAGHVMPMVGVLVALRARGHRIRLRTTRAMLPRMRALGLQADAIDPRIERLELDDWQSRSLRDDLHSIMSTFLERGELEGPDLRSLLDASRPDLVMTDINCWGAAAVAEASGLPWVACSPYAPFVRSAGLPPYGPGFAPGDGPIARARDALFDRLVLRPAEARALRERNALRARVAGLPPAASNDDLVRSAPLTLVASAEPLEYRHVDWEPDLQLVGDVAWEPPEPMPRSLRGIEGPIVVVTTSAELQLDDQIVRTALEALREEPVTVVATMPAGVDPRLEVPPNARVVEFAPHGPLLDRAMCAITYGGTGVTVKALSRAVPVVVVPWGRDQFEVAARVEHAGAGVRVHRRRLTPAALRAAVREASGMRSGAQAAAEGLRAAGGAARAADLVEARLPGDDDPTGPARADDHAR